MPVRSGSGSGGQRKGDDDRQHTGTPQPSSHRPLPRPDPAPTRELATNTDALTALVPELERRLMGSLLGRRGVDRDTAREACQHAFVVFLDKQPSVESVEHVFNWLNIVAHRQVTKWQRRLRWETDDELPELTVPDVAERVESRVLFAAVAEGFQHLRVEDQDTLRSAAKDESRGDTRQEHVRMSVRVHRARERLRSKLRGWWTALPWSRWRQGATELPVVWSPALGFNILAVLVVGGATMIPTGPSHPDDGPTHSSEQAAVATKAPPPSVHDAPGPTRLTELARVRARRLAPTSAPPSLPGGDPRPSGSAGLLDNHRVEVDSPATHGPIEVGTSPRQPEDHSLLCWGNFIVVTDGCIQHPLRSQ